MAPFGEGLGVDLSHFITGHRAVALIRAVRVPIDVTGGSQLSHSGIGSVAGGDIGEGVRGKRRCAHTQCHCHGKYQRLFHKKFLLYQ